jgi:hypothetical protein
LASAPRPAPGSRPPRRGAIGQRGVETLGLQQLQLHQALAGTAGALDLHLDVLDELAQFLEHLGGFALLVEEGLALRLGQAIVGFVEDHHEAVGIQPGHRERVGAQHGRHVIGVPAAVGLQEQVRPG